MTWPTLLSRSEPQSSTERGTALRRRNSKKKMLTLVHKCNVLTHCGDLWVRVHKEMGDAHYPEIKQDYNHVDACTMWFVKQPEYYDVIVTENLFGDIITDLAAIIQGGLGIAAGGNINPEGVSIFEPMGGSAPKYTGNPGAALQVPQLKPTFAFIRGSLARAPSANSPISFAASGVSSRRPGLPTTGSSMQNALRRTP